MMMQIETGKLGKKKRSIAITAILLMFTFGLLYFQIWKKPVLINSGIIKHHLTFSWHSNVIRNVMFSPDGELLASKSFDKAINIWNVNDCESIKTIDGHLKAVLSVVFSNNGQHLASGGDDSTAKLWNAHDWSLILTFAGDSEHIYSVSLNPNGY